MITAAKRALARGVDAVVAGGGDGTINAVASVLAGSSVALGVLPLGTLNHFAKDLNIPLDLDQAIATIARGTTAQVDVGDVNGRIFVNNSSLGLYPHIVRARDQQQRRLGRGKWTRLAGHSWRRCGASRFSACASPSTVLSTRGARPSSSSATTIIRCGASISARANGWTAAR